MKTVRAIIYTRVSSQDQHPEMQVHELKDYIARRGWMLYRVYSDKGISGSTEKRPGLDALLDDCRHGKVDAVVVWKFDRLTRNLKSLLAALEYSENLASSLFPAPKRLILRSQPERCCSK